MATAAHLRARIEATLAARIPAALSLKIKHAPELFSTGIPEADAILDGGVPRGCITEISGAASTGKTSFALATLAAITQTGAACAWADLFDSLSPESAAAAGVVLERLLWLRTTGEHQGQGRKTPWSRLEQLFTATDLLLHAGGFAAIALDLSDVDPQHLMRIPLGTWYRFRLAAEQARTALILLTQSPSASSSAALVLRCEPSGASPWGIEETPLFERRQYTLIRERNRNEGSAYAQKKPSAKAPWQAETPWSQVR